MVQDRDILVVRMEDRWEIIMDGLSNGTIANDLRVRPKVTIAVLNLCIPITQ